LVAILDADKEGFLRAERSLIQTIGRAARNVRGKVIMYADRETDSMRKAMGETSRRRALQQAYNQQHGITPRTIEKAIQDLAGTGLARRKLQGAIALAKRSSSAAMASRAMSKMSVATNTSPPARSNDSRSAASPGETTRRLCWRALNHGSGKLSQKRDTV